MPNSELTNQLAAQIFEAHASTLRENESQPKALLLARLARVCHEFYVAHLQNELQNQLSNPTHITRVSTMTKFLNAHLSALLEGEEQIDFGADSQGVAVAANASDSVKLERFMIGNIRLLKTGNTPDSVREKLRAPLTAEQKAEYDALLAFSPNEIFAPNVGLKAQIAQKRAAEQARVKSYWPTNWFYKAPVTPVEVNQIPELSAYLNKAKFPNNSGDNDVKSVQDVYQLDLRHKKDIMRAISTAKALQIRESLTSTEDRDAFDQVFAQFEQVDGLLTPHRTDESLHSTAHTYQFMHQWLNENVIALTKLIKVTEYQAHDESQLAYMEDNALFLADVLMVQVGLKNAHARTSEELDHILNSPGNTTAERLLRLSKLNQFCTKLLKSDIFNGHLHEEVIEQQLDQQQKTLTQKIKQEQPRWQISKAIYAASSAFVDVYYDKPKASLKYHSETSLTPYIELFQQNSSRPAPGTEQSFFWRQSCESARAALFYNKLETQQLNAQLNTLAEANPQVRTSIEESANLVAPVAVVQHMPHVRRAANQFRRNVRRPQARTVANPYTMPSAPTTAPVSTRTTSGNGYALDAIDTDSEDGRILERLAASDDGGVHRSTLDWQRQMRRTRDHQSHGMTRSASHRGTTGASMQSTATDRGNNDGSVILLPDAPVSQANTEQRRSASDIERRLANLTTSSSVQQASEQTVERAPAERQSLASVARTVAAATRLTPQQKKKKRNAINKKIRKLQGEIRDLELARAANGDATEINAQLEVKRENLLRLQEEHARYCSPQAQVSIAHDSSSSDTESDNGYESATSTSSHISLGESDFEDCEQEGKSDDEEQQRVQAPVQAATGTNTWSIAGLTGTFGLLARRKDRETAESTATTTAAASSSASV